MAQADGSVCNFDNRSYHIPATVIGRLTPEQLHGFESHDTSLIPATAIACRDRNCTDLILESAYQHFAEEDDVWSTSFKCLTLLLCSVSHEGRHRHGQHRYLSIDNSKLNLPEGPLVVNRRTGGIHLVYRLYQDSHHAFLEGTVYKDLCHPELTSYSRALAHPSQVSVPVLSRLYFSKSEQRPLSGLRFAVKDTIALRDFTTGYGSSAYRSTYSPEKAHAPSVQKLLDAGAVLVGIVKTTEFAEGTDPHEWTDTVCPYNPRGEGQQHPSSSSTGSAVAAAAYDWIDFTLGTDTGGSIRHPAGVNGLFGSRTTQGAIELTGVLGATELLNTVGLFARDATTFGDVGCHLLPPVYQPVVPFARRKYKLLYPMRAPSTELPDPYRWFPNSGDQCELSPAEKQMELFVEKLEMNLSCERVCFNIDELWQATRPKGQPETLDEAVGSIYSTLTSYFAVTTCIDKFYHDYSSKSGGQQPHIAPIVKDRQDHGRKVSEFQVVQAIKSMQAFAGWVETVLFGAYDEEAIALMVFPQSFGIPNYRHHITERTELFKDGFGIYAFGYLVGCPDYTVPVGEVPYHSEASDDHKTAYLPVSVSMLARPGNDIPLFDILRSLEGKGELAPVKAGARMYD